METAIVILIIGIIVCWYFFKEMKKDYKKELEEIKNEHDS